MTEEGAARKNRTLSLSVPTLRDVVRITTEREFLLGHAWQSLALNIHRAATLTT